MNEPKNFTDLELYFPDSKIAKGMSEECISIHDLKQLIIDHIKYMRREGREFYNANIDEKSAIPKLMHIFNLNEEDLKDGKRES